MTTDSHSAAVERFLAQLRADEERWKEEERLEEARQLEQARAFWNGELTPDPTVGRFDTTPDAIVLSLKQVTRECDEWLKV